MSTPSTQINICAGVNLTPDYRNTIYFDSRSKQVEYFNGKTVRTFSHYSYIRKNWEIKVDTSVTLAQGWNYLFFSQGGKYYFYFITNVEYVNDSTVKLSLEMDVMQTYFFDYDILPCMVEREHSVYDEIGWNTIDEGLELGEYVTIDEERVNTILDLSIMVMTTFDPLRTTGEDNIVNEIANKYGGAFSGLGIYAVDINDYAKLGLKLKEFDDWGLSEGIVSIWMYPKYLINYSSTGKAGDPSDSIFKRIDPAGTDTLYSYTRRPDYLGRPDMPHYPANNKLFTYPYNFLYITNNLGESAVYKYELFDTPNYVTFGVLGAISPEGTCKIFPHGYNNSSFNYEEGLSLGGFPTCAWNSDTYKLWLAQNQHSMNTSMWGAGAKIVAGAGLAIAGGIATATGAGAILGVGGIGSGVSMLSSGVADVAGQLSQKADVEIQPPQSKGSQSANLNVSNYNHTFTIKRKSIATEQALRLDDYFSMYGYKTMQVKIPNRNSRPSYNYVKTIGCSIEGEISTEDKLKIESIYNKGVTFWKPSATIGDYNSFNLVVDYTNTTSEEV